MTSNARTTFRPLAAEAIGTGMIVFFGCGVVHAAVFVGAMQGLLQVAAVWGAGVALAIVCTGHVSGAHLNPAVTLALAVWRGFSWRKVFPYVAAQFVGAFAAAALLYVLYGSYIAHAEERSGIARDAAGSATAAMAYCEYYPNPDAAYTLQAKHPEQKKLELSFLTAFLAEAVGTALLTWVIAAATDEANSANVRALAPLWIGLTICVLICVLAPLTQACFNPARDFGPRLVAYLAGWRQTAFGPCLGCLLGVYLAAPCVGAVLGMGVYDRVMKTPPEAPAPAGESV